MQVQLEKIYKITQKHKRLNTNKMRVKQISLDKGWNEIDRYG